MDAAGVAPATSPTSSREPSSRDPALRPPALESMSSARRGGSHSASAADARAAERRAPRRGAPRPAGPSRGAHAEPPRAPPWRLVATDETDETLSGTRALPRARAGAARRARGERACTRRSASSRTPEAHAVAVTLISQTRAVPSACPTSRAPGADVRSSTRMPRGSESGTTMRYSSGREGEARSYRVGDARSRALANARVDASSRDNRSRESRARRTTTRAFDVNPIQPA